MNALVRFGLLPPTGSVAGSDPWRLRGEALHRKLEPHELGRVIFHLNQRRGFASNRKTDRGNQDDRGKIAEAAGRLRAEPERAAIGAHLRAGRSMTFKRIRKELGLDGEAKFNLEAAGRDKLDGADTAFRLAARGGRKHGPPPLATLWETLDAETQDGIASILLEAEHEDEAEEGLLALGLPRDAAHAAAGTVLQDGHASLSLAAIRKLLPFMEGGMRYDEAVKAAGYAHHSDLRDGEILPALPYYGEVLKERLGTGTNEPGDPYERRVGRAPNPTVHVALNELRRVVNAIIARHGPPAEIVIEVLRELGHSAAQRSEIEKAQRENRDRNEAAKAAIEALGLKATGGRITRYRLWEEQAADPKDRCCPYTGTLIGIGRLFSSEIEEDHILPFAITLDDSKANRVLVAQEANRRKARQAPFEAFGGTPEWAGILRRAALLPPAKRWRFQEGALEKWRGEGEDFLARHLTDSAYIARLARFYLSSVCDPDRVWTVPGRLTALVRDAVGLNGILGKGGPRKDRTDHRHHAVDALTVGLIDRSLLQRLATAARRAGEVDRRLLAGLEAPWEGFADDARRAVAAIVVSFKPDHGTGGRLHNDTAYGAVATADARAPNVVTRKPLGYFLTRKPEDAEAEIRDPLVGAKVAEVLRLAERGARAAALSALEHSGSPMRRVRTWETLETRPIASAPYKRVKLDTNHRFEFWRLPGAGGRPGKVVTQTVALIDAAADAEAVRLHRPVPARRPHPAAKLLVRLHKNDLVALGEGSARRVLRVVKFSGRELTLAEHTASGDIKARDADPKDPFRYVNGSVALFTREKGRKVWVDPAGRLHDPGPSAW